VDNGMTEGTQEGEPTRPSRLDVSAITELHHRRINCSASFIGSASTGSGVLNYQGRNYKFTTTGGGIGGFGLSSFDASGTVYNLKSVADFDGPYAQLRTGLALGEQGKGKMWLRNSSGVSMALSGRRKGLALSLGADALVVTLAR
jgi:hypothetical protein